MSDISDIDTHSSTSSAELQQGSTAGSNATFSTKGDSVLSSSKKDINWDQLPGFQLPHHSKRQRRGWVWEHAHEVEETATGKKFWLCKLCHKQEDVDTNHLYAANGGTAKPIAHMQKFHGITKSSKKQPQIFEAISKDNTIPSPVKRNIINYLIQSFQPAAFKTKLIWWIVYNNVAFDQVESQYFCEMMLEANSSLEQAGCLPTQNTIREWIMKDWRGYEGIITKVLRNSNSLVNISFDMWSSMNCLSLCGIVVHFINDTKTFGPSSLAF